MSLESIFGHIISQANEVFEQHFAQEDLLAIFENRRERFIRMYPDFLEQIPAELEKMMEYDSVFIELRRKAGGTYKFVDNELLFHYD